jgi:hypothetical protein
LIEFWKLHSLLAQGNPDMRLLLLLVLGLLFLGSSPAHAQSESGGELAMIGEFYAESVSAKSGEVWLGLYRVGDEYELRNTTLVVNERRSERMDTDFKEVQTNQPSEPLFLVRGLEELQPGEVETIIHDGEFIFPGHMKRLRHSRFYLTLAAVGEGIERRPFEVALSKYKLMLWADRRSQTLVESAVGFDDAFPRVIWAGDLDRDGEIDLFMDTARHYQSIDYTLFLSSAAKDEEIVGQVARWRSYSD